MGEVVARTEKLAVNPASQDTILRRSTCGVSRVDRRHAVFVGPLDGFKMPVNVEYSNLLLWPRVHQYFKCADPIHDGSAQGIFGHIPPRWYLRGGVGHIEGTEQGDIRPLGFGCRELPPPSDDEFIKESPVDILQAQVGYR